MQKQALIEALRTQGLCPLCLNTARVYAGELEEVPQKDAETVLAWGKARVSNCSDFLGDTRYLLSVQKAIEG